MDWQKEVGDEKTQQEIQHIFSDRIYVFTPAGDVLDLLQDATPLDFAYRVHQIACLPRPHPFVDVDADNRAVGITRVWQGERARLRLA